MRVVSSGVGASAPHANWRYEPTAADRVPWRGVPDAHLGYDATERTRPFASFFRPAMAPLPDAVSTALAAGPLAADRGYGTGSAVARLSRPGYDDAENGWTVTRDGTRFVACLTDMPGVTPAMWDWWFGWHGGDPARYKLWHPQAHLSTWLGEDRSAGRTMPDRDRYVGNVSHVQEYIGPRLERLAIRFVDPVSLGFPADGALHVCARVGLGAIPVAAGWLVHQVRPTTTGSEMRSRFFLGHSVVLPLPPAATSRPALAAALRSLGPLARPGLATGSRVGLGRTYLRDLFVHCAQEMNHLAAFLPGLYAAFHDVP